MGKASSAKKVARAARAGGKTSSRERPKLLFPLTIFAIIVLGTLLVVYARAEKTDTALADAAPSSVKKDHWHNAYGIYVCDHFIAPLKDAKSTDENGIHTHGEGIIHIHPFVAAASGPNAKMKVFADQVGLTFYNDGFKLPDGTEYRNGTAKCGDKPAKVAIYRWAIKDPTKPTDVFESGFGDIQYRDDRDAYTIAVVPQDMNDAPPQPDSVATVDKLDPQTDSVTQTPTGTPGATPGASDPTAGLTPPVTGANGAPVQTPPVTDASGAPVPTAPVSTPPVTDASGAPTPTPAPTNPSTPAPGAPVS